MAKYIQNYAKMAVLASIQVSSIQEKAQVYRLLQCWGKLLLKVMHYNIALLPKKVTNYVT